MNTKPDPFPVRKVAVGKWEVLITQDDRWHSCISEEHARLISLAPLYEHECTNRIRSGLDFANELEQLANAFEKNGLRFGAGFFRDSAEQARG
jgi:hypothetical protein